MSEELTANKKKKGDDQAWMLTFADLLSLVLTFFVLLYSMSVIQMQKWEEIVESLSQRLNPDRIVEESYSVDFTISSVEEEQAADLSYLYGIIYEKFSHIPELANTQLLLQDDRLVISLPGDTLFNPGAAALNEKAYREIALIGESLSALNNKIEVYGHTDPTPLSGEGSFPSNWELSLSRALTIAGELQRAGYTHPVTAIGLGASRFNELPRDIPEQTRYRMARRVDIIVRQTAASE